MEEGGKKERKGRAERKQEGVYRFSKGNKEAKQVLTSFFSLDSTNNRRSESQEKECYDEVDQ